MHINTQSLQVPQTEPGVFQCDLKRSPSVGIRGRKIKTKLNTKKQEIHIIKYRLMKNYLCFAIVLNLLVLFLNLSLDLVE